MAVDMILTEEQARAIESIGTLRLIAPDGRIIGYVDRTQTNESLPEEIKRRFAELRSRPGYTGAQVQARLQAFHLEWDQSGGLTVDRAREILRELDYADPPSIPPQEVQG